MRCSVTNSTLEQVKAAGAINIKPMRRVPVIFAELTDAQVQQLRAHGAIVTPVGKVMADIQAPVAPPVPVAGIPTYTPAEVLELIGFEDLRQMFHPPIYGEGLNLAIIGTGIRETHQLINGRVVYSKNYTDDPMLDGFDHCTGVCSLALAVVPEAGILNMKVLGNSGEGTEEAVVEAIDDCLDLQGTEFGPCILNLSLGAVDDGNPNNALRVACRTAVESGVYICAAAGNLGPSPGTVTSPACEQYVFAVGSAKYIASDGAYLVSDFSSRGPTKEGIMKPDAVMFGEDIEMASSASDTAIVAKSGTSFATPIISGFGLLYLLAMELIPEITHDFPGVTPGITSAVSLPEMIDDHLTGVCLRPTDEKTNDVGWGLVFGPLVAQFMRPTGIDLSALLGPMIIIMMMGMMMKTFSK